MISAHPRGPRDAPQPAVPAGAILFELLVRRREVRLRKLFDDDSLPAVELLPSGPPEAFRWRLAVVGPSGALMQVGLPPALIRAVGLQEGMRSAVRHALAAQWIAPLLPALRRFFAQTIEVRVEEVSESWSACEEWADFRLAIPPFEQNLPGRLASVYVSTVRELIEQRLPVKRVRPQRVFAGTQICLPVSVALRLKEGDVLLCDESPSEMAGRIRLYAMPQSGGVDTRYLATVCVRDGRIEHVSPGPWWKSTRGADQTRGPFVMADIMLAHLMLSSASCDGLAIGRCIDDWQRAIWLSAPEMRICGSRRIRLRPTAVAGCAAFEVLDDLNRPE